jgi:hypothetical protein
MDLHFPFAGFPWCSSFYTFSNFPFQGVIPEAIKCATLSGSGKLPLVDVVSNTINASSTEIPAKHT